MKSVSIKAIIKDTIKNVDIVDKEVEFSDIINIFENLSFHRKSKIKLYEDDSSNYLLEITFHGIEKWKIDCPLELNKFHRQCYASKKKCLQVIEKIYNDIDTENLKGFTDVPVRHYTLDQMLEFKREDEMLLQGKDPDMEKPVPKSAPKPEKAKSAASVAPKKDIDKSPVHTPNKEIAATKPPIKTSSTPKESAMPLGQGFQI